MRQKGLIVVLAVLVLSSVGFGWDPAIPLAWDGNPYQETGNGAEMGFNRIAWVQYPDPVFPAWTHEYRCDRTSWRFTAAQSGAIQAVDMYTSTPAAKMGTTSPQLTFSIETDNGGSPSGVAIASYTGTYGMDTTNQYTGTLTAPMNAALVQGTTYHLVVKCDSLVAPSVIAHGDDYANSAYDFRLTGSSGNKYKMGGGQTTIDQFRTHDGSTDSNLMGLYYNQTAGGAYENTWREASPGTVIVGGGDGEKAAQKRPLFAMYANYDVPTQTASNPIPALTEGYNSAYNAAGVGRGRHIRNNTDAVGEEHVADYPTALPSAYKIRVYLKKDTNMVDPDGNLTLELRDSTNTVVGTATVPSASIPYDNNYYWAEGDLDTAVPLVDGQTYTVSARTADMTVAGGYGVGCHQENATLFPDDSCNFYGTQAFVVESTDAGVTWSSSIPTRDISFGLDIVIPGDANGDHNVNVGDLGILAANYGQSPRDWGTADFNGDTTVNVGDLGILAAHYGEHLPEPATLGLLVFGGLALLRRRRR